MQKKPLSDFHPWLNETVVKEFMDKFKADLVEHVENTLGFTGEFHSVHYKERWNAAKLIASRMNITITIED